MPTPAGCTAMNGSRTTCAEDPEGREPLSNLFPLCVIPPETEIVVLLLAPLEGFDQPRAFRNALDSPGRRST